MTTNAVRVLLVGMMGSGKTTVGRALAELTGWPYVDNDAMVTELSGTATEQLQASQGGDALHALEAVVVDRILALEPPLVAGIPGSAIASDALRAHLRAGGHVVWLRARLDTLAARIGDGSSRPFFAGHDVGETLARLYEGREPLYAAAAQQVVDVDDLTPQQVAQRVLDALPRRDPATYRI
jgi:shikimate kinase